jgi:hypothetical protein
MKKVYEKRRHPRVPAHFPVKFCKTPSSARICQGALAKDVSTGGVRFCTESFLPRDSRIFVEFALPENGEAVKTFAKVAWMRTLPAGYRFEIGTEFTELTLKERLLLESLSADRAPRFV